MDWIVKDEETLEDVRDLGRVCRFICCFVPLIFLLIWAFDAFCGAIYFAAWSPNFELVNMNITYFNVTPTYHELQELELDYHIQFFIQAQRFGHLRKIEKYNYHVTTDYDGFILGESDTVLRPSLLGKNNSDSCIVNVTQRALHFPLEYRTWSSLQNDTQVNNNVFLQVQVDGKVGTGLFWVLTKTKTRTCDVNITPSTGNTGGQLVNMTCKAGSITKVVATA
jgi:hypothetical protein